MQSASVERPGRTLGVIAIFVLSIFVAPAAVGAEDSQSSRLRAASPLGLLVEDGRVTAKLKRRPLGEVLEALRGTRGLHLMIEPAASDQPVSANFDDTPLLEMIQEVLEPFNSVVLVRTDGVVLGVFVLGLKGEGGGEESGVKTVVVDGSLIPSATSVGRTKGSGVQSARSLADTDLPDEIREAFENSGGPPPPELMEQFYPTQPPGTELTGPPDQPQGRPVWTDAEISQIFGRGVRSLDELDLSEAQRAAFEVSGSEVPPELVEIFYPEQPSGGPETGPGLP